MQAIISLKKAERVLGEVDLKIEDSKNNIKKFGEQADEITEGIKRSEVEHKKELADLKKKLNTLRDDLSEQQKTLDTLVTKRAKISNTVARWKEHVATLRDAHESATQPEGVVKAHDGFDVPEPPSTIHTLSEFGLLPPALPSAQMPNVDSVAGGKSTNYGSL
jgi:septal ring factor EnvC (AmiA/AmiB activator)